MASHAASRTATLLGLAAAGVAVVARVLRRPARGGSEPNAPRDGNASEAELWRVLAEHWDLSMRKEPAMATLLGGEDARALGAVLADPSAAGARARAARAEALLGRLRAGVRREELSEADALNLDLVRKALREEADEAAHRGWHFQVNQLMGAHLTLARLAGLQSVASPAEARAYAARLRAFLAQAERLRGALRDGVRHGRTQPNFIVPLLAEQCEAHLADPDPERSVFYAHAQRSVAAWPEEAAAPWQRREALLRVRAAVEEGVRPGYRLLAAFFRGEYQAAARPHAGLWSVPGGAEYYAWLVRRSTTTAMTPDEVHATGLREVARLRRAIVEVLRGDCGRAGGTFAELKAEILADRELYFSTAEEVEAAYSRALDAVTPQLPRLFGVMPRAGYVVRRMEAYAERAGPPAMYYPATRDGSRPGSFLINTHEPSGRPRFSVEAVAYHEGVPGHHQQVAIQQELPSLPRFRTNAMAGPHSYLEGWALYCERLPLEAGLDGCYEDPLQRFGQLNAEIWRACRLAVDTGIHHLRWTREEAVAYLAENTFLSDVEVRSEVDRFIAMPGQATAYCVGMLTFRRLRDEALAEAGDRFDYRAFHDAVLGAGAVPLDVLEARMRGLGLFVRDADDEQQEEK